MQLYIGFASYYQPELVGLVVSLMAIREGVDIRPGLLLASNLGADRPLLRQTITRTPEEAIIILPHPLLPFRHHLALLNV